MQQIPPLTPLLYRKTGVCRGISNFLIFDPKHTLWVQVRTALARQFYCVPTMNDLSENIKTVNIFVSKKTLCIEWASFCSYKTAWKKKKSISINNSQHIYPQMSRVLRKTVFCICENKGADQGLCFSYSDSTIYLLLITKIPSL